jgi:hypothetical protein
MRIDAVSEQHAFNLVWGFEPETCNIFIDHFKLEICDKDASQCNNPGNYKTVSNSIEKEKRAYAYTGNPVPITEHNNYCFILTTVFSDGTTAQKKECTSSGNEICMSDHPNNWCGYSSMNNVNPYNANLSCDASNNIISRLNQCPLNYYCSQDGNNVQCIKQQNCEKCNSIFGLFGYQGFSNLIGTNNNTFDCPSFSAGGPSYGGCYIDYTRTAVDKAYACNAVDSCYDYFSKDTCVNDYCKKFTASSSSGSSTECIWQDYNTAFNKGVCRPKDTATQQCGLCNDPAFNRLYPQCTSDTCGLYGSCYFDTSDSTCLDSTNVYCSTYDTATQCIGGKNVSVEVTYTQNNLGNLVRIGGTNKLLASSNDTLKIGRCKWMPQTQTSDSVCIKDADNNNIDDCDVSPRLKTQCERDTSAPNTTIANSAYYGLRMNLQGSVSIADKGADGTSPWAIGDDTLTQSTHEKILIYYCIVKKGTTACYPNKVLHTTGEDAYTIDLSSEIASPQQGQQFTFYYYAQDPAMNLERVKSFDFAYDNTPPIVKLDKAYNVFDLKTEYRTNLTFNIKLISESSLPVTCSLKMTSNDINFDTWEYYQLPSVYHPNNKLTVVGQTLSTTYPSLPNAQYSYELTCTDAAGNVYTESDSLLLDGDPRINNPSPKNVKLRSSDLRNMNMSINAVGRGECRYTPPYTYMLGLSYGRMTPYPHKQDISTNNILYWDTMDKYVKSGATGIYTIYSVCNISIGGAYQLVYGDSADTIHYSIDDAPPVTTAYDYLVDTPYIYTEEDYRESLGITLVCNDSRSELTDNNDIDMSFGCTDGGTYYCIARNNETYLCDNKNDFNHYSPFTDIITFDYTETTTPDYLRYGLDPVLCYYSTDKGGNSEDKKCIKLNLKNTDFLEMTPYINISDGKTSSIDNPVEPVKSPIVSFTG